MAVINVAQLKKISLEDLVKEIKNLPAESWIKLSKAVSKGEQF